MRSLQLPTRGRRGFSLIEVIVAMVIGSTIFGLSIELLMLAKRETAIGSERTVSTANLTRLGEQFPPTFMLRRQSCQSRGRIVVFAGQSSCQTTSGSNTS